MTDLKILCQQLGWKNAKTYIQSGNVVFDSEEKTSDLEVLLEAAIKDQFGFDVPVIIRTSEELLITLNKTRLVCKM
jgi:uncharacterized protein (DUF1697 family)